MQGRSPEYDVTYSKPHTAVYAADVIQDNKVVDKLEVHSGSVAADRTAANMRSFQLELIDRTGTLTPTDMTSTLAPFGTRMQIYRGVRIKNTDTVGARYDAANPWTSTTPDGVTNGVTVDTDGALILGP